MRLEKVANSALYKISQTIATKVQRLKYINHTFLAHCLIFVKEGWVVGGADLRVACRGGGTMSLGAQIQQQQDRQVWG